jgi:hypothetical protein
MRPTIAILLMLLACGRDGSETQAATACDVSPVRFASASGGGGALAITEVMSLASDTSPDFTGPDFWELTNFGSEERTLRGYWFRDNNPDRGNSTALYDLVVLPGESVVICRTNTLVYDEQTFIDWWGANDLPADLKVRFFTEFGFDGGVGDEVWLFDDKMNVVERVQFGTATRGRTFTYDPESGEFGFITTPDEPGAFYAARSTDLGSPGRTTGPIPLGILEHPQSKTVDGCGQVTLQVRARGMPRPAYQWYKDGALLNGATESSLVIDNASSAAGLYHVVLHRGNEVLASLPATIIINTNPLPPMILRGPSDLTAFPDQTAQFCVEARGYPCLNFQWQLEGADLRDEANSCVRIRIPSGSVPSVRQVSVRVWNEFGSTNATAWLRVTPWDQLIVTEVMSWPANELFSGHKDWFELTNIGFTPIDLQGYRLRDAVSFTGAFVICNPTVIQPGESIIFVDEMTPEAFRAWWGETNLPPNLQIVTFSGFAFHERGDTISIWNAAALDPSELMTTTSFARSQEGVSFEYESAECYGEEGCLTQEWRSSIPGVNGAFIAAQSDDIGSPGYISNPVPRILNILPIPPEMSIRCRVIPGFTYQLLASDDIAGPWRGIGPAIIAEGSIATFVDPDAGDLMRFYRVEQLSLTNGPEFDHDE